MSNKLSYVTGEERYAPLPPSEAGLQTIVAEKFLQVSKDRMHFEGLCFDRNLDLWFCSVQEHTVYKIDMNTKEVHEIYKLEENQLGAAVKIHKDGTIFVCTVGIKGHKGFIMTMNPDGTDAKKIIEGYQADDLVFDHNGGFYFTDMQGSDANPIGGVYYVSPDFKEVIPFISNLASPNGVALSMNEKTLWVTEHTGNRLLRIPTVPGAYPVTVYRFTGYGGVDSCVVDEDDNVYCALFDQARYLVFNNMGFPIANILLPDREKGYYGCTSHPQIKKGTHELYLTGCDDWAYDVNDRESAGAWIFKCESFGLGNRKSYQFRE